MNTIQQNGNAGGMARPFLLSCALAAGKKLTTDPAACGDKNPDGALICALQTVIYAGGKNCGKKVQITRTSGKGGSITVTVADECPR